MSISGFAYTLHSGDAAFIFPSQHHYYEPPEEGTDNLSYLVIFYPNHAEDFYFELTHMTPEHPIVRQAKLPPFLPQLFGFFYESFSRNPDLRIFKGFLSVISACLLSKMELKPAPHSCDPDATHVVLSYISQHYKEPLSLKVLEKELGISTAALSRIFSQNLRCSFPSYLNKLRLEYAKRLLRLEYYSIPVIAQLCGFQSGRSFFRNFKRHMGMTPNEFRQKRGP